MTNEVIIILGVLLLGTWFLLDEGKTFWEKLAIVFAVTFAYVAFRLITGATIAQILSPFTEAFSHQEMME